jgi:hypothetical protein
VREVKRLAAAVAVIAASLFASTVAEAYPGSCRSGHNQGSAWYLCTSGSGWYQAYATFRNPYTGSTVRRHGNYAGIGQFSTVWGPGSPYVRISNGLDRH